MILSSDWRDAVGRWWRRWSAIHVHLWHRTRGQSSHAPFPCDQAGNVQGEPLQKVIVVFFQWNPGRVVTEKEDRMHKKRNALSLNHIKDSLKTTFKKRPNNKRFYLINYTIIMLAIFLPFFGEHVVGFNYVRTRYGCRGGRLTSLDASFMRCFGFFQTSSKTLRSMFFSKHRWNIASLSKKCDVFHDVLGFRKATQSRS